MNEDADTTFLSELLVSSSELPADDFTAAVMAKARPRTWWFVAARRVLLAAILALITMPLEDLALTFAQALTVALIDIEPGLAAELFAPVNTVGALLSAVLLALRLAYLRIFRR